MFIAQSEIKYLATKKLLSLPNSYGLCQQSLPHNSLSILCRNQCDQIGRFLKSLRVKFSLKSS